jgi:hypothetical protein
MMNWLKKLVMKSKKALILRSEPSSFEFLDTHHAPINPTFEYLEFIVRGDFVKGFSFARVPYASASI